MVCIHFLYNLMVSGLCLLRSRRSLTTPGPPEAHPQNIGVFFRVITNPFIMSQQQKNSYFSRMVLPASPLKAGLSWPKVFRKICKFTSLGMVKNFSLIIFRFIPSVNPLHPSTLLSTSTHPSLGLPFVAFPNWLHPHLGPPLSSHHPPVNTWELLWYPTISNKSPPFLEPEPIFGLQYFLYLEWIFSVFRPNLHHKMDTTISSFYFITFPHNPSCLVTQMFRFFKLSIFCIQISD